VLPKDGWTVSQVSEKLGVGRGGSLTEALEDLSSSGFIAGDRAFDPMTGKEGRMTRYRLSDNYLRFYLKYVAPHRAKIEKGLYANKALETLPNWDVIMGLQFENLLLSNLDAVRAELGIGMVPLLNAGAYTQTATKRRRGCQIDLLLRTKRSVYVVEAKFRERIRKSVVEEIREKVERLDVSKKTPVRTALIYQGELEAGIEEDDGIDFLIPFERLLG
jgi:AAA+ ATPase superfamily predicted ATPase